MAQQVDNKANPEQLQRAADPAMKPTVELHRTKEDAIEEFIQQHGTINLDWYVPDLCNTRVGDLIKKRLQLETMEGRILFSSPALIEFFKTSNFELNLKTGRVFTYLDPQKIYILSARRNHLTWSPSGTHYKANKISAQCKRRDSKEFQV